MNGKYIPMGGVTEHATYTFNGVHVYFTRQGNICTLTLNGSTTSDVTSWTTLFTTSARYYPERETYFANALGGSLWVGFALTEAGVLKASLNIPSGYSLWGTVTYIAKT